MAAMGPDELNDFLAAAFPGTELPMRVTSVDEVGVVVE